MADFGLTEETYSQNYFRQGQESTMRFPVKWMAPESLSNGLFTEATDVVYIPTLEAPNQVCMLSIFQKQ